LSERLPKIEEWDKLYKTAIKIKDIAPWEWLEEHDLFAVQNPDSNEIGFVSIMGAIGEHYAISVYLGEKGFYGFWDFQQSMPNKYSYQKLFEIPQLQVSFEDRNMLHPMDREIIKKLGLTFRGKQCWPMFRSYRPGFFPWYLDRDEARFLQCVLDQTIEVTLRSKQDHSLLRPDDDESYLLRKRIKKDGKILWQDSTLKVLPPAPYPIEFSVNMFAIEILKKLTPSTIAIEIDVFMFAEPVKEQGMRPFYPYVLMLVDANNGLIVGNELLQPIPTLESMWSTVPSHVAEILAKLQLLPKTILVNSDLLYQLLLQLSENLGVSIKLTEKLPNIDQARASFMEFLR